MGNDILGIISTLEARASDDKLAAQKHISPERAAYLRGRADGLDEAAHMLQARIIQSLTPGAAQPA
jgi:hypothetical protein